MSLSTDVFLHQKLGRYEIRERLGAGGMARVFMGWDTTLERQVAIKILHEHLVEDMTFKERFDREAKLVATLNHPNIVHIYDYDTVDINGQIVCYMVMPFFPGRTLRDVLNDCAANGQKLSHERILEIMLDLSAALGHAHSRGMIHRDVKPSNVMFDEHDHAILADFGIARLKEGTNLTQDGATVGTPAYISPEQAYGLPVDSRTDLYSLGVITYELLTGELPFQGDSLFSLILQHINAPIPLLPQALLATNAHVQSFINRALAKDRDDRYQTAMEFAEGLKSALEQPKIPLNSDETQNITPIYIETPKPTTTQIMPPQMIPQPLPAYRQHLQIPLVGVGAFVAILAILFAIWSNNISVAQGNTVSAKPTAISSMTENRGKPLRSTFTANDSTIAYWQHNTEGDVSRQIMNNGVYRIINHLEGTASSSLYDDGTTYLNGTITMQATLDNSSTNTSGYGIIFRYYDESNYSVFAIDGVERYSIWQLKHGDWHELRGLDEHWTENKFIKPQGQKNQLTVTFTNNQITGYVNDHSVVKITTDEPSAASGKVGVYLASSSTGSATVLVNSYEVGNQVASMTDDSP